MLWAGESETREIVQQSLMWMMLPGVLFGFAVGEYGGHDFQWPYFMGAAFNLVFYGVVAFLGLTVVVRWRTNKKSVPAETG